MGSDFKARLKHLQALHSEYIESNPVLIVSFKDGHQERMTEHEAIIAAIRYADSIDCVEDESGNKVTGLINALIAAQTAERM